MADVSLTPIGWLLLFRQMRAPEMFLSRFFSVKPGGIFSGDEIAIDIERFGEDQAGVIRRFTNVNMNTIDEFTTKKFIPPSYGEAFPVDVNSLLNRMVGVDPFSAAGMDYTAALNTKMALGFKKVWEMISRAIEEQAAQILQTGEMSLLGKDGFTYEIDFFPKATHFPTVTTAWSNTATASPLTDIQSLAAVVRQDGMVNPNLLIMGENSYMDFVLNEEVQKLFDNRRMLGNVIDPRLVDSGGSFQGHVFVGSYQFDIWTYPATRKSVDGSSISTFLDPDKVIMLAPTTRLDKVSARVILPLGPDPRVASFLPPRMTSVEDGFDVTPNLYVSPDGRVLTGELLTNTMLAPIGIDQFACLTTTV